MIASLPAHTKNLNVKTHAHIFSHIAFVEGGKRTERNRLISKIPNLCSIEESGEEMHVE